jgi:hypothetical protein
MPVRFTWFASLILLFSACLNEPDCIDTSTDVVKIAFKASDHTALEVNFTEIQVAGLGKKFYPATKTSSVELPVNPEQSQVTFTFLFDNRTETLILNYVRRAQVVSPSCGAFQNYSGLQIEDTTFEDFRIINTQLSKNATVNIEIFLE